MLILRFCLKLKAKLQTGFAKSQTKLFAAAAPRFLLGPGHLGHLGVGHLATTAVLSLVHTSAAEAGFAVETASDATSGEEVCSPAIEV